MAKTTPRLKPVDAAPISRRTPYRLRRLTRLQLIFTLVLAVPFILQVSLAIGLTSWLLVKSRQQAVEDITSRFVSEISGQVYSRLQSFLETPHTVNQINADAARLGQLDVDDIRKMELRFWRQIQVYDSLSSIGFGRKDGAFIAGDRRGNAFRSGHRDSSSPEGKLHIYCTDDAGNQTELAYTGKPNYDPRVRPWYQTGKETQEGRWTDIFTYSSQPIYVLSAVQAFYDQTGTFEGVAVTDLILSDINNFLQSLDIGDSGEVFIMERSGALVAASTSGTPYEVIDDEARRLQATEIDSALIQMTAQSMWQTFGDLSTIDASTQEDFRVEDERYFWKVLPYEDARGLDWLIVVVLPESDLAVDASSIHSAIALALLAFILSLLVGWLVLRSFVRPIANLAATATDVASGNGQNPGGISRLDDLGAITMAFKQMSKQLQSSLLLLEDQKAKLAEAQQLAQLGSWDYRVDRDEFSCSDELYRILGLASTTQTSPLTVVQLYQRVHPGDRLWVKQLVRQAVCDRVPFEMDYRILHPSGGIRHLYSKGNPVVDESGRVIRLMGTMMDVTARKSAEVALESKARELSAANDLLTQATLELEDRNQDLDRFTYAVSHDLKAPLRAINNLSTWIEEDLAGRLPEESQRQMGLLRQRVARMEALINGLLEFSRVGRSNVAVEAVDLQALLHEVIDSLAPPEQFEVQVQPNLPTIQARRLLLQRVFANLIGNAIKHSDRRSGTVTVTFREQEEQYEFSVADGGPGIAPEDHERIFSIFETLKPGDNSDENTGIGLSLVKRIVELEGGEIRVESALGQGAVFRFTWPRFG